MNAKLSLVARKEHLDLERLARMRPAELQRLYHQMFGSEVPTGNSELARRKIAWQFQAEREGSLPESARQHALAIARESSLRMRVRRGNPESPLPHSTVTAVV